MAQVGADLVNFDFSSHDLSQYDELLLFSNSIRSAASGSGSRSTSIRGAKSPTRASVSSPDCSQSCWQTSSAAPCYSRTLKANADIGIAIGEPVDEQRAEKSFAAFQKHLEPTLLHTFQQFGKQLDAHRKQLDELSVEFRELNAMR